MIRYHVKLLLTFLTIGGIYNCSDSRLIKKSSYYSATETDKEELKKNQIPLLVEMKEILVKLKTEIYEKLRANSLLNEEDKSALRKFINSNSDEDIDSLNGKVELVSRDLVLGEDDQKGSIIGIIRYLDTIFKRDPRVGYKFVFTGNLDKVFELLFLGNNLDEDKKRDFYNQFQKGVYRIRELAYEIKGQLTGFEYPEISLSLKRVQDILANIKVDLFDKLEADSLLDEGERKNLRTFINPDKEEDKEDIDSLNGKVELVSRNFNSDNKDGKGSVIMILDYLNTILITGDTLPEEIIEKGPEVSFKHETPIDIILKKIAINSHLGQSQSQPIIAGIKEGLREVNYLCLQIKTILVNKILKKEAGLLSD